MAATNGNSNGRQNGNGREREMMFDDAQVFPVLTEGVNLGGANSAGSSVIPGSAPLGQIAENAIRQVLGWRPRANDTRGFTAALTQTFALKDVNGHTEWNYTPRGFAVQADLGAVTGAQAAIYKRAKVTLDQVLPLLDGLTALNDPDDEDVQAARVLVRNAFTELVHELAAEGGPRVQRVDDYFEALLAKDEQGHLSTLKERLGLENERVNTIEEEQNLTNFIVLEQYVQSLRASWESLKHFFNREGSDVFLGTQSVLLSRELDVLVESVQEAYFAMDSVFLGQAERQTTQLKFENNEPSLTIAELLSWVQRSASEEIPHLIQDAGKDGVEASVPLLTRLTALTDNPQLRSTFTNHPFNTRRVKRTIEEIHGHLESALNLAGDVRRTQPAPDIDKALAFEYAAGGLVRMGVQVFYLQDGARIHLERTDATRGLIRKEGSFGSLVIKAPQSISAVFDMSNETPGAMWKLVVTNWDDQRDDIDVKFDPPPPPSPDPDGDKPPAPPPVTSTDPPVLNYMSVFSGRVESRVSADVYGENFDDSSTVLIDGIAVDKVFINSSHLKVTLVIEQGTPEGKRPIQVRNTSSGQTSQSNLTFEVLPLGLTRGTE